MIDWLYKGSMDDDDEEEMENDKHTHTLTHTERPKKCLGQLVNQCE